MVLLLLLRVRPAGGDIARPLAIRLWSIPRPGSCCLVRRRWRDEWTSIVGTRV
ncbi:unnamed protein product, partial [Prorocentrum cordatum]